MCPQRAIEAGKFAADRLTPVKDSSPLIPVGKGIERQGPLNHHSPTSADLSWSSDLLDQFVDGLFQRIPPEVAEADHAVGVDKVEGRPAVDVPLG